MEIAFKLSKKLLEKQINNKSFVKNIIQPFKQTLNKLKHILYEIFLIIFQIIRKLNLHNIIIINDFNVFQIFVK